MIRLFLISALCGGLALRGHTQSLAVWIDQLAALQTLQTTVQQAYATATIGLQTIGDIRSVEYQLHRGYFNSLDSIKPAIGNDARLQVLHTRLEGLIDRLRSALDYWQNQPILSR